MRYRVVLEQDEDDIYVAECPSFPGCVSQAKTREEALTNIKDAMAGYLENLRLHNEPIPPRICYGSGGLSPWEAYETPHCARA
ncbi:MAG: hypothetical protein CV089_04115 [Nitrospira sp. WS110]|nr:hypothetical protein [Nitrospira sp. WS110]